MNLQKYMSICIGVMLMCTGCSGTSNQSNSKPSLIEYPETSSSSLPVTTDLEKTPTFSNTVTTANIREENRNFGMQFYIVDYQDKYTYDGNPIPLTYHIKNNGQAFDYAFLVYVNGRRIPYSTPDEPEKTAYHTVHVPEESEIEFTLYLEPCGCKRGETALVYIEAMLNPDYMLPDTSYVNFTPHHSLNGTSPFMVELSQDAPEADSSISDIKADEIQMTPEMEKAYIHTIPTEGRERNRLDQSTIIECFQNEPQEPFIQADNILSLNVSGCGVSGKYLVGIYVDHKLQKAFDGKEYAVLDVERTKKKILHPVVDLKDVSGLHHIYLVAVPYKITENDSETSPLKTPTKLLQIGTASTSVTETTIAQTIPNNYETLPFTKLISDETTTQTTVPVTAAVTDHSSATVTTQIETVRDKTIQSGSSVTFHCDNPISKFGMLRDGTLIALSTDAVNAFRSNGTILGKASASYKAKLQLLDNGFALIYPNDGLIQIYDTSCNMRNEIHPPQQSKRCIVSSDGTRIAYYYSDNDKPYTNHLVTDSIEQNDRHIVQEIPYKEEIGAFLGCSELLSYCSGRIAYIGSEVTKFKPNLDFIQCFGSVEEDGSGNWFHSLKKDQFPITNISSCYASLEWFVIVQDYDSPGKKQNNQVVLESVIDGSRKTVSCKSADETHNATVSENGHYLVTINETNPAIQVYDIESGQQIWKKALSSASKAMWISEQLQTVCWVEGNQIMMEPFGETE